MLFLTLILILGAFLFLKHLQFQKKYNSIPGIPGPPPHPLVGNLIQIRLRSNLWLGSLEWLNKYGDLVQLFIFNRRIIVVGANEQVVKDVYSHKAFIKGERQRQMMADLTGTTSMLFTDGDEWARMRKLCTATFHTQHLHIFDEHIQSCTRTLIDKMNEKKSSVEKMFTLDLDELLMRVTLDVIGKTMFSVDLQSVEKGHSKLSESVAIYLEESFKQAVNPFQNFNLLCTYRRKIAAKFITSYMQSVIRERIVEREKSNSESETKDLLDLLLNAEDADTKAKLTEQEVRDQVNTFLLAGHETTAHSMTWTIAQIARHADVAKKVYEEIDEVVSKSPNGIIGIDEVSKLNYLTAVIKETLRTYPVVPAIFRVLNEDYQIGSNTLNKGDIVAINVVAIQHNPKIWKEPTVFDPSRFLKSDSNSDSAANVGFYSFSPFGHGRRSCIGQNFAMLEMKMILASILFRFRFELQPMAPLIPQQNLTFRPQNGMQISIWDRK